MILQLLVELGHPFGNKLKKRHTHKTKCKPNKIEKEILVKCKFRKLWGLVMLDIS